jgi:hypothetical protein
MWKAILLTLLGAAAGGVQSALASGKTDLKDIGVAAGTTAGLTLLGVLVKSPKQDAEAALNSQIVKNLQQQQTS